VGHHLGSHLRAGVDWELDSSRFLFSVEDIGRILVSEGKTIDFEMLEGVDPGEASPFLLGTAFGALLLQRGSLILHASAIARDGESIAFCGDSGAGKSTLAAALCRSGWTFLSDDVSRIEPDAGGTPQLWPDGRSLKLFEQSIGTLGLEDRRGEEVRPGLRKHYVAPPSQTTKPTALAAIYALRYHDEPAIECVRLSLLDGAQILLNESHRPELTLHMSKSSRHVAITGIILRSVPIFLLKRPRGLAAIDRTADDLLAHWETLRAPGPTFAGAGQR
jgi:hypothetical protein